MSNIKKSHILLRASVLYKSGGCFHPVKDLTECALHQRTSSSAGMFQPGHIRVSAPKTLFALRHAMDSVEHVDLHVPPRAGPGTELIIAWDRSPAFATSVNTTAPFLNPLKGIVERNWDVKR